jgi:hypothetical protein
MQTRITELLGHVANEDLVTQLLSANDDLNTVLQRPPAPPRAAVPEPANLIDFGAPVSGPFAPVAFAAPPASFLPPAPGLHFAPPVAAPHPAPEWASAYEHTSAPPAPIVAAPARPGMMFGAPPAGEESLTDRLWEPPRDMPPPPAGGSAPGPAAAPYAVEASPAPRSAVRFVFFCYGGTRKLTRLLPAHQTRVNTLAESRREQLERANDDLFGL